MSGILSYEHVGIRVTDRETAVRFYKMLGFSKVLDLPEHHANEMTNDAGVTINLIFHALEGWLATLRREGVRITEGPPLIGERRRAFFIRDPDGNVLEFNELLPGSHAPTSAKETA